MNKNILIISGSPQKRKGNSESIADSLMAKLNQKNLSPQKLCLNKEIGKATDTLIKVIDSSDIIILSLPIYENSVPGLVLQFFENILKDKNKLSEKPKKFLVITNSGFPEVEANQCAIQTCKLFARAMNFNWLGGIAVAPGTLIDGKALEKPSGIYKRLIIALNLISEAVVKDSDIPEKVFKITKKSFMLPFMYRLGGRMVQKSVIKKIGINKYLSRPLQD